MHVDCAQNLLHNGREVIHYFPFMGYRHRTWGNVLQPNSLWKFVNAKHEYQESRATDILDIAPIIVYQICSGYDYPETTGFIKDLMVKEIADAPTYGRGQPTSINWRKQCKYTESVEIGQSPHTLSYVDNLAHILGMGRSLPNSEEHSL